MTFPRIVRDAVGKMSSMLGSSKLAMVKPFITNGTGDSKSIEAAAPRLRYSRPWQPAPSTIAKLVFVIAIFEGTMRLEDASATTKETPGLTMIWPSSIIKSRE